VSDFFIVAQGFGAAAAAAIIARVWAMGCERGRKYSAFVSFASVLLAIASGGGGTAQQLNTQRKSESIK